MSEVLARLAGLGVKPQQLTADSRQVTAGSLFLAYPGEAHDGRSFIAQAVAQGAAAVLWEGDGYRWNDAWQVPNLPVSGLRREAGAIADAFYRQPSSRMWMIGVTGTNGKTSCSQWLAQSLTALGRKSAVIGTLGNGFPGALSEAANTTPDPIVLHGLLARYLKQGAVAAAMEVSSHGLDQGRVNGVHFDVAVFTNLTRDHLDYHGDMASYGAAKQRLFQWPGLGCAVLNTDDAFGAELAAGLAGSDVRVMSYGLQSGMVRGRGLQLGDSGFSMDIDTPYGAVRVETGLLGRFNASNLLAVLSALLVSGVELDAAANAVAALQPVAGRMERLGGGASPAVVIDYAHTPDALEKVLLSLREQTHGQLICVFGCGGNRDKGKRPLMGGVASMLADHVVVTSDNPRHEPPLEIINAILGGMGGNYLVEPDRAAAIELAISQARPGDVVLLAGKGHETYQQIGEHKLPFSDAEVARRALEGRA